MIPGAARLWVSFPRFVSTSLSSLCWAGAMCGRGSRSPPRRECSFFDDFPGFSNACTWLLMRSHSWAEKKEEVDRLALDFVEEGSDDVFWALEVGLGERFCDEFLVC